MVALRTTFTLIALSMLTACGMGESDMASNNGTPNNWWSDNYFAMMQDANEGRASPVAAKPIRLRLGQ